MKQAILALFLGTAATRRQLPAKEGYQVGEGSYCRQEADERAGRVEEICRGCSSERCADECDSDPTCAGFDFHERGLKICWLHYDYPQKLMTEGCPECDCYLKNAFEGKEEMPPQAPERPDEIVGFKFEQGKCMSKSGKGYMQSRWDFEGNFFDDGVDYDDCAKFCMDREDCAGFDVWYGNNDCQLFFDELHYGDGTQEEECFLKVGFVERAPPQAPIRPDSIEGFKFGQGKCMPSSGKGYSQSRNEVPGTYYDDGIDYNDCARRCMEREDCAGFDVWNVNYDCQLFFDEGHYADGSKAEECFIKENFVGRDPRMSEEKWEQVFELYDANDNQIADYDEFVHGWRELDSEVEDDRIALTYKFGDSNQDGELSKEEFMALRTVIGSPWVDAFMHMDVNQDRRLSFREFRTGYLQFDKYVEEGTIKLALKIGDMNKDGFLDWDEFHYIAQIKDGNLQVLKDKNMYDHIDYKGYERFDGYCRKEGEEEGNQDDWMQTGIFDLDACAKGCRTNNKCNAFTFYHETLMCYYYKPKEFNRASGWMPNVGVCYSKNEHALSRRPNSIPSLFGMRFP